MNRGSTVSFNEDSEDDFNLFEWERSLQNQMWQEIEGENQQYRADALIALSRKLWETEKTRDQARIYASAAAEIYVNLAMHLDATHAFFLVADALHQSGHCDQALEYFRLAMKAAKEGFYERELAQVSMNAFGCFFQQSHYLEAYAIAKTAGEIHLNDKNRLAAQRAFQNAAKAAGELGDNELAIELCDRAIEICQGIKAPEDLSAAYCTKSSHLIDLHKFDEASTALDHAKALLLISKEQVMAPAIGFQTARLMTLSGRPTDAIAIFDEAIQVAGQTDSPDFLANINFHKALALLATEKFQEAEELLVSVKLLTEDGYSRLDIEKIKRAIHEARKGQTSMLVSLEDWG